MDPASCCIVGICIGLSLVLLPTGRTDATHEGRLLRCIMKFLTQARSDAEHAILREHLLTCRCNLRDADTRILHPQSRKLTPVQCLDRVIRILTALVRDTLKNRDVGKFRGRKANVRPAEQPWPLDPADIHSSATGCRDTLDSLLRWSPSLSEGYWIFTLIAGLAKFYDPLAREIFRDPNTFALATSHLQTAVDTYDAGNVPGTLLEYLRSGMVAYEVLLMSCTLVDGMQCVNAMSRMRGPMRRLASRIHPMLDGATDPVPFAFWEGLLNLEAPPPPRRTLPDVNTGIQYEGVLDAMNSIRRPNYCMHVTCKATATTRTTACSRCGTVRYCDTKCQRAAWRMAPVPHKTLCDLIYRLRMDLDLMRPEQWHEWVNGVMMKRSSTEYPFTDFCRAKGVDPELILDLYVQLQNLTTIRKEDGDLSKLQPELFFGATPARGA